MEFASMNAFIYSNSEDELISSDEYECEVEKKVYDYSKQYYYLSNCSSNKLNQSTSSLSDTTSSNHNTQSTLGNFEADNIEASIVIHLNSTVNNDQFVWLNKDQHVKSNFKENSIPISSIEDNKTVNQLEQHQLFYYEDASSIKVKATNDTQDEILYEDDSNSTNCTANGDNTSLYISQSPVEKLYKQTSLSHVNATTNYVSNQSAKKTYVKVRKPDTNVIGVRLKDLILSSSNTHTGDAVFCETCNAILSNKSILEDIKQKGVIRGKLWDCEYCSTKNLVEIEDNEVPKHHDVTYLIEPSKNPSVDDDSIIVFCIDISGSMNVTKPIAGQIDLKSAIYRKRNFELETGEKFEINDDETHVSRLDSLQLAVEQNLESLRIKYPNKRVFLIAFNDNVTILGDGNSNPVIIPSKELNDEDRILEYCNNIKFIRPIRETKERLEKRLYSLEANGSTALGPALLLGINIAGRKGGSQVILCTDGLANNGFGSLEETCENSINFYDNLTNLAIKLRVSVSIITIKGTGCKLSIIGRLAQHTNGYIKCVDQDSIKNEIESIIENNKILATNVCATILSHKSIYFESNSNRNSNSNNNKVSRLSKKIGNVTSDSEVTFQYGVKCIDYFVNELNKLKVIPFQLQLTYETKDGSKVMRVITEHRPCTKDRKIAEKKCSLNLVAKHILNSQAADLTNNIFSQKTFSSLQIQSRLKSIKRYLNERQYNNQMINQSINRLIKASNSKSKKNELKAAASASSCNSDDESEQIIRLASVKASLI